MEDIAPQEILSRFILDSGCFSKEKNEVKFRAFLPDPYREVSVFRVTGWAEELIWQVGLTYIANPQHRSLKARADILTENVIDNGLVVNPDEPPPNHAVIVEWPDGESKDERKLIAMKLAKSARLSIYPD